MKLFRAVTFRNSFCFGGEIVSNKDIYRMTTFLKQLLLYSINFFRGVTFWKKLMFQKSNIPYYLLFLRSCLFRAATFLKEATFYRIYLSRRAAFLQPIFSEELRYCFFTTYFFGRVISQLRFLSKAVLLIYLLVIE